MIDKLPPPTSGNQIIWRADPQDLISFRELIKLRRVEEREERRLVLREFFDKAVGPKLFGCDCCAHFLKIGLEVL